MKGIHKFPQVLLTKIYLFLFEIKKKVNLFFIAQLLR